MQDRCPPGVASQDPTERCQFEARLAALVQREFGGAMAGLRRLTGGASQEIWSFDVIGDRVPLGCVLRRAPAHDIGSRLDAPGLETEAAVIGAVATQNVPVPTILHVLTPADGLGRGFISNRVGGEALGRRIVDDPAYAEIRPQLAGMCGRILAGIHGTALTLLPDLAQMTPAGSIDQLARLLHSYDEPRPIFEAALIWLEDHCPPATPPQLVHGDFRTGNFLLQPDGISAVLDWEGCHLGDPIEDLGWLCMPIWRFGHLDRPVGGFGQRDDLVAAYTAASGAPVDRARLRFWEVRGMLRWGLTCMIMADAFANGARSIERAAVGRRACEAEVELLYALTGGSD